MKYFLVKAGSVTMCGFDTYRCFKGRSYDAILKSREFHYFEEEIKDYVLGWITEEDLERDEDAAEVYFHFEEITKYEYKQNIDL